MIIKNCNVVLPNGIKNNYSIKISDDIIADIGCLQDEEEILDLNGMYLCPGFVDIHTHGGGGGDFMDSSADAFEKVLEFHLHNGTTSLVATSVTAPPSQITDMLKLVREYKNKESCSRVLGAHIEGPYISKRNKGAQHESFLRVPAKDSYDFILENSDVIKTITIAPELDGACEMIKRLREKGIVVCGGHDDGRKETILPAIEAGLSHCTHLWCAMSTVAMYDGVRSVGLCELGLTDDRLSLEIIADNHHITPEMVKLIYKCKGSDKMCVVSDCLRAGGMQRDGKLYTLGSVNDDNAQKFIVSDGVGRLPDGTRLAGSIQPLSQMLKNLVVDAGIELYEAVKMVSLSPARVVKEDNMIGSIEVGKKADFCVLDKELNVRMVILGGKLVKKIGE